MALVTFSCHPGNVVRQKFLNIYAYFHINTKAFILLVIIIIIMPLYLNWNTLFLQVYHNYLSLLNYSLKYKLKISSNWYIKAYLKEKSVPSHHTGPFSLGSDLTQTTPVLVTDCIRLNK